MSGSCECFPAASDPNPLDSGSRRYIYDVFISFRGTDTRLGFVGHLYAHLVSKGLMVFKDDIELRRGESIQPQLLEAIKGSRVSIVVFSKDYPSSSWCLNEMTAINECRAELKQTVFPVFYDVDPSHVGKQNGVYENYFVSHTERFKHEPDRVEGWKKAMTCLAGLAGTDVREKPEFEEIKKIVLDVIKRLGHKFSCDAEDLVGIQLRVEDLISKLRLNSEDDGFRVLGMWGMDGIGKTTLATALYETISHHYQFDVCCFIGNVSKIYNDKDGGAIAVKKQIIRQTLKDEKLDDCSPSEISEMIRNRVCNRKLLIVLDDVDQIEQLRELRIDPKLLCSGSRIIITTTDVHILNWFGGVPEKYEVKLMNPKDAEELLCRNAFKSDNSSSDYAELIPKVLEYAQGLPLAIIVMGCFLYGGNTELWRANLKEWENNPESGIMKGLQSSFKGLRKSESEIFLHIACFFEGEREDYVQRILDACGLGPKLGISRLAQKSFITIRNQEIHMHKILQEFGKQDVRKEHPDEPRSWKRLWLYRDLRQAMITKTKPIEARAIVINQKEDVSNFNQLSDEDILKMEDLKLLILDHSKFSGSSKFLSNSLCYLMWKRCPLESFPKDFQPYNLVELNMPNSNIEHLWGGIQLDLPALKSIDMSNSKNLMRTPHFKMMKNLKRLDLTGCISLSTVDSSIGLLTKLEFLSLQNCTSLVNLVFPYVPTLISLRVLILSGCTRLENTLNFSRSTNLEYLDMDRCESLSTIDESVGSLAELRFLSLRDCKNLVGIPDGLNNMTSLATLDLYGCSRLTNLPLRVINDSSPLESLIFLDLSFCNLSEIPDAIGKLRCLERLNLQGNNFTKLPSIDQLHNLSYLNLSHCHKLQRLPVLPSESGPSDLVGRYFKTLSGSRNHRSGLYVFDTPGCLVPRFFRSMFFHAWIIRLLKEPLHFRCGFDIVFPCNSDGKLFMSTILHRWFEGGTIVRIKDPVMDVEWLGFLFCVTFELNNHAEQSSSSHGSLSSSLPHPFYLSFESEYTEERFDMPLNLELKKVDGKPYLWMIYISREHCHFVKTGAHITFKGRQDIIIRKWELHLVTKNDTEDSITGRMHVKLPLEKVEVSESSSDSSIFEPKIQLPYNWSVSDEDEAEKDEAKGKETHLFNLGLLTETESPQ